MRWLMYYTLLILCILPVFASGVYQDGDLIDLKVNCVLNGSYCSDSAVCNISVLTSNNVLLVDNVGMTNGGSYFNFTFNKSGYGVGVYRERVFCSDGGVNGYYLNDFKVTPSGVEGSVGDAVVYSIFLVICLVVTVLSFVAGSFVDGENKYDFGAKLLVINYGKHVKTGLFALGVLFLWFLSFCAWQVSELYLMFNVFSGVFYVVFLVVSILMPFAMLFLVFLSLFKWLADHKLLKSYLRNLPIRRGGR